MDDNKEDGVDAFSLLIVPPACIMMIGGAAIGGLGFLGESLAAFRWRWDFFLCGFSVFVVGVLLGGYTYAYERYYACYRKPSKIWLDIIALVAGFVASAGITAFFVTYFERLWMH